ncbi:MAG: recombinase family protein [Spirochaetia bacterium]|nr:recombinase family protein [Spirochaetia bacterium]
MSLRFAPLIRVSTETQADKGESLRTQMMQIQQYVKSLNGNIPENCLRYAGQEHATPELERKKLDQLLEDSSKNKFDAVIVCDTSRWSRDNLKSKEGLNILRNNGIRFFVGTMEYDLFNPEHNFILGMSAEVGELQARQQSLKSITNRIERARRGIPTSGKLPYGRIFDKKDQQWKIDQQKKKNIQWAAEQYLNGKSIVEIAKVLDMNFSNLWTILTKRSGKKWECRFRATKLNIDETVVIHVPPLLDNETIQAIKEQGEANKTYHHGSIKHQYLLSRMVFCKHCGYSLSAQTNHNGKQYFRHPKHRKNTCSVKNWIPAEPLGEAVLTTLFQMFGDEERIEKAIRKATPDIEKIQGMQEELEDLRNKKKEAIQQRERLIKLTAKGTLTEQEVTEQIMDIRDRIQTIETRIDHLELQVSNQPNSAEIKKKSKLARSVLIHTFKNPGPKTIEKFLNASFEKKRNLIERAFSGKDSQGNRLGVYVEQTDDLKSPWKFEIRAILNNVVELFADENINTNFALYSPGQAPP